MSTRRPGAGEWPSFSSRCWPMLAAPRVDARWVVIEGGAEFFRITKRIHNHLHGFPGDGGSLGEAEREVYEAALTRERSRSGQ